MSQFPPQQPFQQPGQAKPSVDGKVDIVMGIVLMLVTCGIYGLVWRYKQMSALNSLLGREEFNFVMWFFLTILTCGIYGWYYEYKMAGGVNEALQRYGQQADSNLPVVCLLCTIFGLLIVSIAIQQSHINKLC